MATLVLYVWIAPQHIVYGDNAEFSTLGTIGGAAHPTGYPLYLLWLRAWSWLPAHSPAHTAALATAILSAIQVLVLHAACRAWGARPLAATFAVGLFAAGPSVMRIQSEAEVFALNGLIVAAILWLAAARAPVSGLRRVLALGLVAGLGLSNHLTCVLVAPVGIFGLVRGVREATQPRALVIGGGVIALGVGLLPYGYLLVTPDTFLSWGKIEDLSGLVHHFLRTDYGGPSAFSPHGATVTMSASLGAFAATLGRAYLWLPALLGLAALGYRIARPGSMGSRTAWGVLAGSWLLAGPILVTRFNVEPAGTGLYVVQRFYLLATLILAIPLAVGIDHVADRTAARISPRLAAASLLHAALTVVGFAAVAGSSLPEIARVHSPAVELAMRNMLLSLPPNAVVIGTTDIFHFGTGYLQGALGERPDVTIITAPQLGLPHYRERIHTRIGIVIDTTQRPEDKPTVTLAAQVLATGRPLFIDPYQANIATSFPVYPYGLVFRILPRGSKVPPIDELFAIQKQIYEKYELGYAFPQKDGQLAAQFHQHYARPWAVLADEFRRLGRGDDEAFARALERELAPR